MWTCEYHTNYYWFIFFAWDISKECWSCSTDHNLFKCHINPQCRNNVDIRLNWLFISAWCWVFVECRIWHFDHFSDLSVLVKGERGQCSKPKYRSVFYDGWIIFRTWYINHNLPDSYAIQRWICCITSVTNHFPLTINVGKLNICAFGQTFHASLFIHMITLLMDDKVVCAIVISVHCGEIVPIVAIPLPVPLHIQDLNLITNVYEEMA